VKNANLTISPEIARALNFGTPVVALESTVITHGLPQPQNLELARDMEQQIRNNDATPATVALLDGEIRIGLSDKELIQLSEANAPLKVSLRDFATAIVKKKNGGTTVAGTMFAAQLAGIRVFATGGIGGVHKESAFDISTDLRALAEIPMIVVCAGAKAILDLPATLEYLETMGVPVVGYQTDEFPAFYSRESGYKVQIRLNSPDDIVELANIHWQLGMRTSILVTQPIPEKDEISKLEIERYIDIASNTAKEENTRGQQLTPFLLDKINKLSNGQSLKANLSLLINNAHLAAQIAGAFSKINSRKST